ncbi:hypothetical protein ACJJTC_000463 [Scirpophaga incertulas]
MVNRGSTYRLLNISLTRCNASDRRLESPLTFRPLKLADVRALRSLFNTRRRLADSLFASFKLPRKKDGMSASRSLAPQPQQKRKSAVELLAETKAFYVKSETVLDRKQELPLRMSSGLGQAIASGGCHLVSSGNASNDACCSNSCE